MTAPRQADTLGLDFLLIPALNSRQRKTTDVVVFRLLNSQRGRTRLGELRRVNVALRRIRGPQMFEEGLGRRTVMDVAASDHRVNQMKVLETRSGR